MISGYKKRKTASLVGCRDANAKPQIQKKSILRLVPAGNACYAAVLVVLRVPAHV